ncbi:hypothetical protein ACGFXC_24670 [Streptomyces sp. NPDC048507]|uniref:hypothetical protein n=1 Tax=Streptomyces sp. NPDC048507 TaxID=3365560 RepID=UPI003714AAB3
MSGTAPRPVPPAGVTVRRLRPGTAATVLRDGLHLRGRRGSVTLEGSAALPALWRALEPRLRAGEAVETLLAGLAAGSAVRAAVETLTGQLEAHDLLVTGPAGAQSGPAGCWLAAGAADPDGAARALAAARAEVLAQDLDGPLARAAGRALERGGLAVSFAAGPALPEGRIHLHAHGTGPVLAVAAGWCGNTGYVTRVAAPDRVRADAAALESRLALAPGADGADGRDAAVPGRGGRLLLVGAAAQRLLCAVAGLPDPAREGDDDRLVPGLPAVLLAQGGPARAEYRTWLGPGHDGAAPAPAGTLREALRRVAALGDERCGPLSDPGPGDLAQLPVPLAACAVPGGTALAGGAPRLDLARLEVFCRAAERGLAGPGGERFTVGANPGHARGRALRAAAARRATAGAGWAPVPRARWAGHPQARHWWTTLTVRLAVPARLYVSRAASGAQAYRAVVREADRVLGEAVEATPGDAAAYAGLAAVAAVAAAGAGGDAVAAPPSGGAGAALAVAGARTAAWEDGGWTGHWLAAAAAREEAFQDALGPLAGPARPAPAEPGQAGEPGRLLRAFGFTVLHTREAAP